MPYQPPTNIPAGGRSSEEFRNQLGYGIATLLDGAKTENLPDPNQPRLEGLKRDDRAVYLKARGVCHNAAYDEIYAPIDSAAEQLEPRYDELNARVSNDSRMVEAQKDWSSCLASKGYRFSSRQEIESWLHEKLRALQSPDGVQNMSRGKPPSTLIGDQGALAALQREEVAVASYDAACWGEHVQSTERLVRSELEPAFVEKNIKLLRVLKARDGVG